MGHVGFHGVMALHPDVVDGVAVADHQSGEAPLLAQNLPEQAGVAAAGLAVDAVVGAHHLADVGLLHQVAEGGQIGFPEVAGGDVVDVDAVAAPLGAAVHGVVLGTGEGLVVAAGLRLSRNMHGVLGEALETADDGLPHAAGQVRVLAVGLLTTAPAGVAEDVDVGGPDGDALEGVERAGAGGLVVLGTLLGADGIEDLI